MNKYSLSGRKRNACLALYSIIACCTIPDLSAQQYRFSAGINAGGFSAIDRSPEKPGVGFTPQAGIGLGYRLHPRWTIGAAVTTWIPMEGGLPTPGYLTRNNPWQVERGVVTGRFQYIFTELYGRYDILARNRHTLYGSAGLSYISGQNEAKDGTRIRVWDLPEPYMEIPVRGPLRRIGGLLQAGYRYDLGPKRHYGLGADLSARFAGEVPLQLYYSINFSYHFGGGRK